MIDVRSITLHTANSQAGVPLDAAAVLLIGLVIVIAVIYDAYRQYGA